MGNLQTKGKLLSGTQVMLSMIMGLYSIYKWSCLTRHIRSIKQKIINVDVANSVMSKNNGKLMSFCSQIGHKPSPIVDDFFGPLSQEINAQMPLSLKKKVEIFQWTETKRETNERSRQEQAQNDPDDIEAPMVVKQKVVTYIYALEWCTQLVDTTHFQEQRENPGRALPVPSGTTIVPDQHIKFGSLKVSTDKVAGCLKQVDIDPSHLSQPNSALFQGKHLWKDNQYYYVQRQPGELKAGDIRISFGVQLAKNKTFSVLGQQQDDEVTNHYDDILGEVLSVKEGVINQADHLGQAVSTWHYALSTLVSLAVMVHGVIHLTM